MKTMTKRFGQLIIILILTGAIVYSNYANKDKIDVGVLYSSIYVNEYLNTSIQTLEEMNNALYDSVINHSDIKGTLNLKAIRFLTDSICEQIKTLKEVAIDMSGGMKEKGNLYSINNLEYNFGHKNKLTGDKGKNNGEGSKLKLSLEKLRSLEKEFIKNSNDTIFINKFLNTSDKIEMNSDYMFSWEEQYFKLLPTVGVINMLTIVENNVLNSERVVLVNLLQNN